MSTEKTSRRAWFGHGLVAAMAALVPWKAAKAVPVEDGFVPLHTGPYTRVFRKSNGMWAEIEWEAQKTGDEVIHFGVSPGCQLICHKVVVKSLNHINQIEFSALENLAPRA